MFRVLFYFILFFIFYHVVYMVSLRFWFSSRVLKNSHLSMYSFVTLSYISWDGRHRQKDWDWAFLILSVLIFFGFCFLFFVFVLLLSTQRVIRGWFWFWICTSYWLYSLILSFDCKINSRDVWIRRHIGFNLVLVCEFLICKFML